jgi:hypothetical protein
VRAPAALTNVVVGDSTLVASVNLDVGGVQVDRYRLGQLRGAGRGQQVQHRGVHIAHRGLDRVPLPVAQPLR